MKRLHYILFVLYILAFATTSKAQINPKTNKLSLKIGIGVNQSVEPSYFPYIENLGLNKFKPNYSLELNYNAFKNFDAGLYTGYSQLYYPFRNSGMLSYGFEKTNAIFYGINATYHILPLLMEDTKSRFDVYATLHIGMVSQWWKTYEPGSMTAITNNKYELEYGAGLGVAYSFTPKLAIFGEYNIGNYVNSDITRFKVGLRVKL